MGSVLSVFQNESNEAACDSRSTQTKMQQQSAPTGYPMPMMQGAPMMAQPPMMSMGTMSMPMYAGSAMGLPTNPPPELEGDKLTPAECMQYGVPYGAVWGAVTSPAEADTEDDVRGTQV